MADDESTPILLDTQASLSVPPTNLARANYGYPQPIMLEPVNPEVARAQGVEAKLRAAQEADRRGGLTWAQRLGREPRLIDLAVMEAEAETRNAIHRHETEIAERGYASSTRLAEIRAQADHAEHQRSIQRDTREEKLASTREIRNLEREVRELGLRAQGVEHDQKVANLKLEAELALRAQKHYAPCPFGGPQEAIEITYQRDETGKLIEYRACIVARAIPYTDEATNLREIALKQGDCPSWEKQETKGYETRKKEPKNWLQRLGLQKRETFPVEVKVPAFTCSYALGEKIEQKD